MLMPPPYDLIFSLLSIILLRDYLLFRLRCCLDTPPLAPSFAVISFTMLAMFRLLLRYFHAISRH